MKEVFLDAASNTPMNKTVFKSMKPYLSHRFVGNSRSIHDFGIKASQVVDDSRETMSKIFKVPSENIVFTSGATESNNTVIKGLAYSELSSGKPEKLQRRHIICSATEHDSVINPCKQLEKIGFTVTYIKPREDGCIHLVDIKKVVTNNTLLICVMAINNELGVRNFVKQITNFAKRQRIYSLVDCTQLVGYGGSCLELGELYPNASFFSFSGHKIYGPTGTGCLVATGRNFKPLLESGLIVGGAQERGIRGGTINTAGVVGLCTAVRLMHGYGFHVANIYRTLFSHLMNLVDNVFEGKCKLNAVPSHFNIISLNFGKYFKPNEIDSLAASLALRGIAVSAGSACDSQHDETAGDFNPSHVLAALNLSEHEIRCTIRVSFNINTKLADIDKLIQAIVEIKKEGELIYD
jgi:cysteine desulfurase